MATSDLNTVQKIQDSFIWADLFECLSLLYLLWRPSTEIRVMKLRVTEILMVHIWL